MRQFGDDDRAGFGQRLQPRGQIRCLTDDRLLLLRTFAHEIAHDDDARRDADPGPQRCVRRRCQLGHRIDNRESRAHGTLRIILVAPRPAEIDEHAVAHELGDVALEACNLLGDGILVCGDYLARILRVEPGNKRGRIDKVTEHHSQLPALGARRSRRGRRSGRCCIPSSSLRGQDQSGSGRKKPPPMPYGGHADRHEIVRSQMRQNLHINVVVAESLLVLSEPQAPQPACNVHVFGLPKTQITIG